MQKQSKSQRRKKKRSAYYALVNNPAVEEYDRKSGYRLKDLKEIYFRQVDLQLEMMGPISQRAFIQEIHRTLNHGDWVEVYLPTGSTTQIKANLWDYIESRQDQDPQSADAVQYLLERAVQKLNRSSLRGKRETEVFRL